MRTTALATIALLGLSTASSPALAGPAADRASQRIRAIGAGELPALLAAYDPSAVLLWVGGPLDGSYSGARLAEVWSKFRAAQGPLTATVARMQESGNPKGATVTADVLFAGKAAIKVRYVLTYRGDRLVGEVWQVDPALAF